GAKYIDKNIKVLNTYMPSSSSDPFNDPVTGKNLAQQMIDRKSDILFHVAELSGDGVFKAAKENNIFAIGCDSDEDGKYPGTILTSVRVRIDNAVYKVIKDFSEGIFVDGYTLANFNTGGISLTDFTYTKDIIGEKNLEALEKIKQDIISGKIKINE
ncbi:MAG: BMP family lipoprotein, partial [Fusobacteriaceae bacterium]